MNIGCVTSLTKAERKQKTTLSLRVHETRDIIGSMYTSTQTSEARVDLIGTKRSGRDLTLRFALDDIPASTEEFITYAQAQGEDIDPDKTRERGVRVGQHMGFGGFIKSEDDLETVNAAVRLVHWSQALASRREENALGALKAWAVHHEAHPLAIDMSTMVLLLVRGNSPHETWREVADEINPFSLGPEMRSTLHNRLEGLVNWEEVCRTLGNDRFYLWQHPLRHSVWIVSQL